MSLLLNPSTLDESSNDPAVRRCVNNAALWGYGAMEIGNLFALRSTDPGVPLDHPDPVAPDSDHYLQAMLGRCDRRTRKPMRRPGRGRRGTPPKTGTTSWANR